ncbi:MAG: SDR family NAD(P)-dependent oxidoreductase [Saprospiraceae bacterium]|nr:SDR family NAD(P)-dependent oxidoreductase [Saprospiraceae bacterium]
MNFDKGLIYTLITGASTGLGKALAYECASRAMNLILTSLPGERLNDVRNDIIRFHDVDVKTFEGDLTKRECVSALMTALENRSINMVINNAGIGGSHEIDKVPFPMIDSIIALNIGTTAFLSCALLPKLSRHERAYILNVSSIISQYPVPFKTVYPASKAFIYSFTRGLNEELKETNISVSVLLPGPMTTNGSVSRRIQKQGFLGEILNLDPKVVAKIAVTQILKGKKVIIPGILNNICWGLMKSIPKFIGVSLFSKIYKREVEEYQYG